MHQFIGFVNWLCLCVSPIIIIIEKLCSNRLKVTSDKLNDSVHVGVYVGQRFSSLLT